MSGERVGRAFPSWLAETGVRRGRSDIIKKMLWRCLFREPGVEKWDTIPNLGENR
jgi:hypothetical protein